MSNSSSPTLPSAPVHAGWVIFALAMGGFVLGTTEFAAMSLLPYISHSFNVTDAVASHAITAYALGVVVGAPIITVLAAKVPRRALLLSLVLLMGIGNALSAVAPSLPWFLFFRFASGLPHGAYFGVAALLAASLVPKNKRAQAVSRMILGLTIATIVGVPFATFVGQSLGWRWGLGIVAILAFITFILIRALSPNPPVRADANPLRELSALRNRQVWLTLGTGAIGFGGMFCVYTYLSSTMLSVTHAPSYMIPIVLCVFGVGSTVGNLVCGWAADKSAIWAAGITLASSLFLLLVYPTAATNVVSLTLLVFLIGCGIGLSAILQTRLMDVSGDAQSLAGALLQSAFNIANAIGPWVGGIVITHGGGVGNTGYAAALLTFGGLLMWVWSLVDERKTVSRQVPAIAVE